MSPDPKVCEVKTVQDFFELAGAHTNQTPLGFAQSTITAVKLAIERGATTFEGEGIYKAGSLKKLFGLTGDPVSPEFQSLLDAPDESLVNFPNLVTVELAFDVLKKNGQSLLERACFRNWAHKP